MLAWQILTIDLTLPACFSEDAIVTRSQVLRIQSVALSRLGYAVIHVFLLCYNI